MDRILADAAIFQGVDPAAVTALIGQLRPVEFPAGHVFFTEGDPGDRLYIVVSCFVRQLRAAVHHAFDESAAHRCPRHGASSECTSGPAPGYDGPYAQTR